MKRFVLTAIALSTVLVSCSSNAKTVKSPDEIAKKYLEHFKNKEVFSAKEMQCFVEDPAILRMGQGRLSGDEWVEMKSSDGYPFHASFLFFRGTKYRIEVWDTDTFKAQRAVTLNSLGANPDAAAAGISEQKHCVTLQKAPN